MDTFVQYGVGSYEFTSMISLFKKISGDKIEGDAFIKALFEKGFFKRYKYNASEIRSVIDEVISKGKFENALEFIDLVKEQLPDYVNFPLIIMNDNIPSDEKVKALKAVYKQKDFPKYKDYFRENLTNLQHLDDFIEATIIQNNRVKEKDANLIKFFKDIFVHGDYRTSRNILNRTLTNKKAFSEKYSEKFSDPKFTKKFYIETVDSMSTLTWERKQQYESLMAFIFSCKTIEEQIDIMAKIPQLKCLGNKFNEKFADAWSDGDYESCRKLLKVFVAWSETEKGELLKQVSSCGSDSYDVISKFMKEDCLDDYLSKFKLFTFEDEDAPFAINLPNRFSLKGVLRVLFRKEVFNKVKLLEDEDITVLGFNYEKILKQFDMNGSYAYYRRSIGNLGPKIQESMEDVLEVINDSILGEETELKKQILERFFARFENDENSAILVENFMSINANDKTKEIRSWNTNTKMIDVMMGIFSSFKNIGKSLYSNLCMRTGDSSYNERMNEFLANMDDAENTLKLVCLAM